MKILCIPVIIFTFIVVQSCSEVDEARKESCTTSSACSYSFLDKTGPSRKASGTNSRKTRFGDLFSPEGYRRVGGVGEQQPKFRTANSPYAPPSSPGYNNNSYENLDAQGKVRRSSGPILLSNSKPEISTRRKNETVNELRLAGISDDSLNETVEFDFQQEELEFVVQQILGGVLEVNYLIAEPLEGIVTFRTERPVNKIQSLSILRNILGSNGYVLRQINGVFQIGSLQTVNSIVLNSTSGKDNNDVTRVIYLKNSDVVQLSEALTPLLSSNTSVVPYLSNNSLLIRSSQEEIDDVVALINEIVASGVSENLVEIIPVYDNSPEMLATQLGSYFEANSSTSIGRPIIVPLVEQKSLMVGVKDRNALRLIKSLINSLDQRNYNQVSLRVLKLNYSNADTVAQQLNDIFASGITRTAQNTGNQEQTGDSRDPNTARQNNASISTPALLRNRPGGEAASSSEGDGSRERAASQLSNDVSIVADVQNNSLLVRSNYEKFKQIKEAVDLVDLPPAQVAIEITIAEVALNDTLSYGIQWFLSLNGLTIRSSSGITSAADGRQAGGSSVLTSMLGNVPVNAVLDALQEVTDVNVISSPYLTVMDNKSGTLSIGDQISFITRSQSSDADGNSTVTNEINTRDTGIILEVTPRIRADKTILLNIIQEISSASEEVTNAQVNPTIKQRRLSSDLIVESGKTVLLGGLIEESETKSNSGIPVLSRIKVLGSLFGQKRSVRRKSELLIMITPRIIRQVSELETITKAIRGSVR